MMETEAINIGETLVRRVQELLRGSCHKYLRLI